MARSTIVAMANRSGLRLGREPGARLSFSIERHCSPNARTIVSAPGHTLLLKSTFSLAQKCAAGSWGRSGRSRTRSGDGEGWGRDREREFLSLSARRNNRGRGGRFAKQDPGVRVGLRLTLHKAIAGPLPRQDLRFLIIENEFATIGLDRQHGMAVAFLVAHDGDEQRLTRPSSLHQHAPLEQNVILAVTEPVVRIVPAFNDA